MGIQVSRTGFFGFEGPYYDQKVLPFHSYFNESTEPSVSYEIHEGSRSQDILSYVDSIIHEHESTSFATKWLLLVTWEDLYFFYSDDKVFILHTFDILLTRFLCRKTLFRECWLRILLDLTLSSRTVVGILATLTLAKLDTYTLMMVYMFSMGPLRGTTLMI